MNTSPIRAPRLTGRAAPGAISNSCARCSNDSVPVKPYTSEQPYSSRPDASAPRTKYLSPASVERVWSRWNAVSTYSGRLCSSSARYRASRLFAEIIMSMPTVENSASSGNSKRSIPSSRRNSGDMIRQSAAPSRVSTFRYTAKRSVTKWPPNVVASPWSNAATRNMPISRAATHTGVTTRLASGSRPRKAPTISNTRPTQTRTISVIAGARSNTAATFTQRAVSWSPAPAADWAISWSTDAAIGSRNRLG